MVAGWIRTHAASNKSETAYAVEVLVVMKKADVLTREQKNTLEGLLVGESAMILLGKFGATSLYDTAQDFFDEELAHLC